MMTAEAIAIIYEEGKIYAQNPTYGKLISKDNPVVKVKISNGPSRIKVPDLTGLPEIEASQVAARENFTIGKVVEEYNDKVPIGAVIRQDPMGGLRRPPGTPITIYISRGPRIEQPEPEYKPEAKKPINTTQTINMEVIVPDTYEGPQVVRIIVNDDRGERTVYERTHQPGDSITKTITVTGTARVRVYVGDNLERDETY